MFRIGGYVQRPCYRSRPTRLPVAIDTSGTPSRLRATSRSPVQHRSGSIGAFGGSPRNLVGCLHPRSGASPPDPASPPSRSSADPPISRLAVNDDSCPCSSRTSGVRRDECRPRPHLSPLRDRRARSAIFRWSLDGGEIPLQHASSRLVCVLRVETESSRSTEPSLDRDAEADLKARIIESSTRRSASSDSLPAGTAASSPAAVGVEYGRRRACCAGGGNAGGCEEVAEQRRRAVGGSRRRGRRLREGFASAGRRKRGWFGRGSGLWFGPVAGCGSGAERVPGGLAASGPGATVAPGTARPVEQAIGGNGSRATAERLDRR